MRLGFLSHEPWVERAACGDHDNPDAFHPDVDTPKAEIKRAKALCKTCSVQAECLAEALRRPEDFGLWGGTSVLERRRLRRLQDAS